MMFYQVYHSPAYNIVTFGVKGKANIDIIIVCFFFVHINTISPAKDANGCGDNYDYIFSKKNNYDYTCGTRKHENDLQHSRRHKSPSFMYLMS